MDQQKVFDPFLAWKEMYDKTESYWGKVLGENMNKEEFSQWMGNVLNLNLQYHQTLNETTGRYFQQVNIPTKDDVASVASLVINVEEKVDALEDRLDEWQDNQDNSAIYKRELNKLKSDIKSLEKKLDKVLDVIDQQQQSQLKLQTELQEQLQQKLQQQNKQLQASFQEQLKLQEQAAAKEPAKEPAKELVKEPAKEPAKEIKGQKQS